MRRLQAVVFGLFVALAALPALAHEGHDHAPAPVATPSTSTPRLALQSDAYELVGIVQGEQLRLYLDKFETNEPVNDAKVEVTVAGDAPSTAKVAPDGTYVVASPKFTGQGSLDLMFVVAGSTGEDLLTGTLQLPARGSVSPAPGSGATRAEALRERLSELRVYLGSQQAPLVASLALAFGLLLGLSARAGRRAIPVAGLALILLLASVAVALSHEGHDHGPEPAPITGDAPRRLSDGSLFLPKPTQRVLSIRTAVSKVVEAQKSTTLIGRIVVDPNKGGIVQSLTGGRIQPAEGGLPRVGQRVSRGDVLALVEPALPAADRTTISERVGEIEQQIAVAETKLRRIRQLADRGIAPQSQVVDAETEIEGLRRRREIVRQVRVEPEVLRAPADGLIAAARVVAGQVVQPQDVLFQIVDPSGFWVEALAYGEVDPARIADSSGMTSDGTPLRLTLVGFSRTLQQQAAVIQLAIEDPPASLSVGQPVTVIAKNGAPIQGTILPREAVVRGANGEALVWRHTEPERFEPRPVRTKTFDATRLVVHAGIAPGERIVVRGAELINQIR